MAVIAAAAVVVWFGFLNSTETVTIRRFPDGKAYPDRPLNLVLLVSFLLGMAVWMVVSVVQFIGLRRDLRRSRRENQRLREELKTLRNLPVQDLEVSGDLVDSEETLP
jgi:uncharacterized integral membrane protein